MTGIFNLAVLFLVLAITAIVSEVMVERKRNKALMARRGHGNGVGGVSAAKCSSCDEAATIRMRVEAPVRVIARSRAPHPPPWATHQPVNVRSGLEDVRLPVRICRPPWYLNGDHRPGAAPVGNLIGVSCSTIWRNCLSGLEFSPSRTSWLCGAGRS